MDEKEYEALLVSIEQMIEASLRGYRRGDHFQILAGRDKTAQEHDRLYMDPMPAAATDASMRLPAAVAPVAVK